MYSRESKFRNTVILGNHFFFVQNLNQIGDSLYKNALPATLSIKAKDAFPKTFPKFSISTQNPNNGCNIKR